MKKVSMWIAALKYNLKEWKSAFLAIAGALYTILSVILSFQSWEELGVETAGIKIAVFIIGLLIAAITSGLYILVRKTRTVWSNGTGSIVLSYDDIVKFAFSKSKEKAYNLVIPVNTSFDTIVDRDTRTEKKLVSQNTIHGKWIDAYIGSGKSREELDAEIDSKLKEISPIKELSKSEKERGKRKVYPIGTIIPIRCQDGVTAFLVAISDFDSNNNAQSDKDKIIQCAEKIVEYSDKHGNGESLYLPLFGTGQSRAGLSHEDSLRLIRNVLELNCERIHGKIQIVIWTGDRDKVSIYPKD